MSDAAATASATDFEAVDLLLDAISPYCDWLTLDATEEEIALEAAARKAFNELRINPPKRAGFPPIAFNSRSWNEFKRDTRRDAKKVACLSRVAEVIESGEHIGPVPDYKGRKDGITAFHYFKKRVELLGEHEAVTVTVGQDARGHLFWNALYEGHYAVQKYEEAQRERKKAAHDCASEGRSGDALTTDSSMGASSYGRNPDSAVLDDFAAIEEAAQACAHAIHRRVRPTPAQQAAGNYKLGRASIQGLAVSIENPRGSIRTGVGPGGKAWSSRMAAHYGFIDGTRGADGDGIDCFIGPWPEAQFAYVINQRKPGAGTFDEHKVMLGFVDEEGARRAYLGSYERGWKGLASIVRVSLKQLRWWMKNGNTGRALEIGHLPFDGDNTMDSSTLYDTAAGIGFEPGAIRPFAWNGEALIGSNMAQVMYQLRSSDAGLDQLLDSVTEADILADCDGVIEDPMTYDALVVEAKRIERTANALMRVLGKAAGDLKPVSVSVSKPMTRMGAVQQTILMTLSDGQTITIWFHNPDSTPKKLKPTDELISWKWMLNKKDITIAVAPERGQDIEIPVVARRIMALAERNAAAFAKARASAEGAKSEREQLQSEIKEKTEILEGLVTAIETRKAEIAKGEVTPAPGAQAEPEVTPEPRKFNELSPDEQRAAMKAERDSVTAEALQAWMSTWRKATGEYRDVGYRVVAVVPGLGQFQNYSGEQITKVSADGLSYAPASAADRAEFEDAVRGGQVTVNVYPLVRSDAASVPVQTLVQSRGRFEAFDYTFNLPSRTAPTDPNPDIAPAPAPNPEPVPEPKPVPEPAVEPEPKTEPTEDPGILPPGFTEATAGGMAASNDPVTGGIIDKNAAGLGWFVIFNSEAIAASEQFFATRAAAIEFFNAKLAEAQAAQPETSPAPTPETEPTPEPAPTKATLKQGSDAINALIAGNLLSRSQRQIVAELMHGEEAQFFLDKMVELANTAATMPKNYGQDGKGDQAIAYLHYFMGGSDWYITEADRGAPGDTAADTNRQCFGFVVLNGDVENAELGYIDMREITGLGAECDFHWTPKTLAEMKRTLGMADDPAVDPAPPPANDPAPANDPQAVSDTQSVSTLNGDPESADADVAFLRSVIGGDAVPSGPDVAKQIKGIAKSRADLADLVQLAAKAYSDRVIANAKKALAA